MDRNIPEKIIITHAQFTGEYVQHELEQLGKSIHRKDHLHIETRGTLEDAVRLNLMLRNAHRVLFHLHTVKARTLKDLYFNIKKITWEDIIPVNGYFSIHSYVRQQGIQDFRIVNLKAKDAIADRFFTRFNRRPDSGNQSDRLVLFIHWENDLLQVYLDTSGESLSKRGYRIHSWKAPLAETLAASLLSAMKWATGEPFLNPMCGSGTLAIEAALIATDRYPGLFRKNYSFLHMKHPPRAMLDEMRIDLKNKIKETDGLMIRASDIHPLALKQARANAEKAGVVHLIDFRKEDFRKMDVPEKAGALILNPEYGTRLGEEEKLIPVYREIGDFFKKRCPDYMGYVFSGNFNLMKHIGLRTRRRIPFKNGNIECRLLEYEMYIGSKKGAGSSPS